MSIDLHIHTTASDGLYSPTEIVMLAKKAGVDTIAIADHDTVDGFEEALRAVGTEKLRLVPAVEINSYSGGSEYHILGYFIDHKNKKLLRTLAELQKSRMRRMYLIISKLESLGITVEADEVLKLSAGGAVGRPHIARILVRKGYVNSFRKAFDKYIGEGKPAYEPRSKLTPEEAITIIREAGGLSVYAHPGLWGGDELIPRLVSWGIVGIEVYSPDHTPEQTKRYRELAHRFGLITTGGSDFHGSGDSNDITIGEARTPLEEFLRLEKLARK